MVVGDANVELLPSIKNSAKYFSKSSVAPLDDPMLTPKRSSGVSTSREEEEHHRTLAQVRIRPFFVNV